MPEQEFPSPGTVGRQKSPPSGQTRIQGEELHWCRETILATSDGPHSIHQVRRFTDEAYTWLSAQVAEVDVIVIEPDETVG